jgi:hypothetical protein
VSGLSWFVLGMYTVIGGTELSRWWHQRRAAPAPPATHEALVVPLGFRAELRERNEGKMMDYIRLEGRWLILIDDVTRIMNAEAERLDGIGAPREAHVCRQVAEMFASQALEFDLQRMGGEDAPA